ncbi:MAG TPA: acetyl-CoA carboxylase biotin carboxyl carrier protein subunit [Cyclobacteriaceae bacterium]|nr:acetyl-CoA carboxylase biotin carboxyl carrier protein subunit [Cyclobacteriaceae bacterium]
MQKAIINGKEFEITQQNELSLLNGNPFEWDISKTGENHFHILYNNKGYNAEIIKTDKLSKTVSLKINGKVLEVQVKDKFDLLLEKMGMSAVASSKINHIKAPMPGLIIDIKVKEGDEVKANEPLLILEAMKMENIIKSPGEGKIKNIKIKKGDSVEKNQVLIEF